MPGVDHRLLDARAPCSRNRLACSSVQKPITRSTPARLYQLRSKITTSPAAGKCGDVALDVHLRLLALGRRGQRDDAEHARAHPLGDRLDRAALAGGVAALEHDADLGARRLDPLLHRDQLAVQRAQLGLVLLALHLAASPRLVDARLLRRACRLPRRLDLLSTWCFACRPSPVASRAAISASFGERLSRRSWMALSIAVNAGATSDSAMTRTHWAPVSETVSRRRCSMFSSTAAQVRIHPRMIHPR